MSSYFILLLSGDTEFPPLVTHASGFEPSRPASAILSGKQLVRDVGRTSRASTSDDKASTPSQGVSQILKIIVK
jgi:hypothetical protein